MPNTSVLLKCYVGIYLYVSYTLLPSGTMTYFSESKIHVSITLNRSYFTQQSKVTLFCLFSLLDSLMTVRLSKIY